MAELLVLESIVLIVISALYIRRKLQCRSVLQNIIKATESSGGARQQVLENTLKDMFKDNGENAGEVAAKLVRAEGNFHKRLLTTFIEQDHDSLKGLFKWTDKLLSPYRTMISDTASELDDVKEQSRRKVEKLESTVETLSKEKTALTKELDHTRQELDSIMSEYVSAFDKEKQLKGEKEATKQKYNVQRQDAGAGVYKPVDEGITVEEETAATSHEAPQAAPPQESVSEAQETAAEAEEEQFEISIEEGAEEAPVENDDEGMLKIEDLEDPVTQDADEPAPQDSGAILDDVDIDSLIEANSATAETDTQPPEEMPQAAAASRA